MDFMEAHRDIVLREIFHFLFLESLMRVSDPRIFVLKGGVNLRFFFNSPRYSEDVDLDVLGGSSETLKKNCYKILEDKSFSRSLTRYGIKELLINDPTKAKQTSTTQRFKIRLLTNENIQLPTKIEFSRRGSTGKYLKELINPEIANKYHKLSFECQHYVEDAPVIQKIEALAGRAETQARDVFDLHILLLGGYWFDNKELSLDLINSAKGNLSLISYEQYRDQVVEYLSEDMKGEYSGSDKWEFIKNTIFNKISI